jgi:thioredoxin-dependent peroxiredoxin
MKLFPKLLLGLVLVATLATARAADLKVGDPAPDFSLPGTDGKVHKLADYKGKQAVVLAWFPRAFTPGCTAECKSMRASGDAIRKYDVAYFTASVDPLEGDKGNEAFAKSLELDFPILSDSKTETAKAYGVYNEERKIANRWTFYIGKDGKILAIDKAVKTGTHGTDVAAKLQELGVPQKK